MPYLKAQYGDEWDNDAPIDLVHFYGFGEAKKPDQCKVFVFLSKFKIVAIALSSNVRMSKL